MSNLTEIQTQIDQLEDYSTSLEVDVLATKDQIRSEVDETHIIFLMDHLNALKYELNKANVVLYLLRQKIKELEIIIEGVR